MQAITSDLSVSAPPASAQPSANPQQLNTQQNDFKKTLQDTDDKPVRKSGKHLPDPGNDPPAAPAPVTTIAPLCTNLAVGGPTPGALKPPVDDSASLANVGAVALAVPVPVPVPVPVAVAGTGASAVAFADAGRSVASTPDIQSSNASLIESSSIGVASEKGTSPTAAAAPSTAQTAGKSGIPTVAVTTIKSGGDNSVGAANTAANALGASAATGDSGSSVAVPTADADVTSQTILAATMAAAATAGVAPVVSSTPSADTAATPVTGAAPADSVNMAEPTAMDAAEPASAAVAASVAQVVIGAAESPAAEKHPHAPTAVDKSSTSASIEGAAGFAQLVSSSSSADAAPANLKVAAGVDTPGFAQGVGSQVQVMVDNNLNTAKLQVNPSSLGPIEVRIAIQNGHAQVWMTSHSAVTRDALESSTPQLKEMLGSQGFSQVSVDISQRSFQERTPQPHSYDWQPLSPEESAAPIQSAALSAARGGSGVVDAYA